MARQRAVVHAGRALRDRDRIDDLSATAALQLYAEAGPASCAPPTGTGRSSRTMYIRVVLRDAAGRVPLEWLLSRQSRNVMLAQIDSTMQQRPNPGMQRVWPIASGASCAMNLDRRET